MPKFILESVGWGLVASSLHYSIPIAALRLKNLYSPPVENTVAPAALLGGIFKSCLS